METARIAEQFSHGIGGPIALSLIAFSTVFIVLVALTLTIMAIRYLAVVSERKPSKPEGPGPKTSPAPPAPPAPPAFTPPAGPDKNVTAAVIAAALAASGIGRPLSLRPLEVIGRGKPTAWKMAGRMDLLEGFE
ncbi:MAG TPA: OadG family protein [Synergistales bacterium]|nr:OadG family protein [Synergistales bacterium]